MGRLNQEARGAMTVLLGKGHSKSDVARLLGVTEGTVRDHEKRLGSSAIDGRSRQKTAASAYAEAILHWRDQQGDGAINLAPLQGAQGPERCGEQVETHTSLPATLGGKHQGEQPMPVGTVKWFDAVKGFGFISPEDGGQDAFVHISEVQRAGLSGLAEGQRVEFELVPGKGGKSAAAHLTLLD